MSAQASLSALESDAPMPADNNCISASRHAYCSRQLQLQEAVYYLHDSTTKMQAQTACAATIAGSGRTLTSRLTKCKSGVSGRPRRTIDSYDCSSSCRSSSFSSSILALPTANNCRAARATNKSSSSGEPSLEDCANAATQSQNP